MKPKRYGVAVVRDGMQLANETHHKLRRKGPSQRCLVTMTMPERLAYFLWDYNI